MADRAQGIESIGPYSFRNPYSGNRLTTDTLLIADFVLPLSPDEVVLELGTGAGAIPLILCWKSDVHRIVAVEIEPELAALAEENIKANGLSSRVEVLNTDWRNLNRVYKEGTFELVMGNLPYIKRGCGRLSPDPLRAGARYELYATLDETISVSTGLVSRGGRLCFIYPVERFSELTEALRKRGFGRQSIRFVHPAVRADATLFLIEARRGSSLKVLPPLIL